MTPKPYEFLITLFSAFSAAAMIAAAESDASLRVESLEDGLAFYLVEAGEAGPWLLQHSPDARGWDDLLFLEGVGDERENPGIEIQWGVLPEAGARQGFFRAVQLADEDPFRQRFLTERAKWRLSGYHNYQYELRQNFGQISWHGIVVVTDAEIASFETIDLQPPVVEVPDVPTIDGLFDRIASAIAADAATIDVTWHPILGLPTSCSIDLDPLLADEESGWTIDAFNPAP